MLRVAPLITCLIITSCVLSNGRGNKQNKNKALADWQDYATAQLTADQKFTDAWLMLSESPYENRGQVIVLSSPETNTGQAHLVPRNAQAVETVRALSRDEFTRLAAQVKKAAELNNYEEPSFDGVRYTYIHLRRDGTRSNVEHRIEMLNPGSQEPRPQAHVDLVEAFYKLL